MAIGIVPEDWRIANAAEIHKQGPMKECGNYRPVSLTFEVSKLLETLGRDAIIDHLYLKKLIRDTEHGFTKGRSCLTNLLTFLEEALAYGTGGQGAVPPPNSGSLSISIRAESRHYSGKTQYMFD